MLRIFTIGIILGFIHIGTTFYLLDDLDVTNAIDQPIQKYNEKSKSHFIKIKFLKRTFLHVTFASNNFVEYAL